MQCAAFTPGNRVTYCGDHCEVVEWDVDARTFKLRNQHGLVVQLTLKTVLEQYMLKNLRLELPSTNPSVNKHLSKKSICSLMLFASSDAKDQAELRLKFLRYLTVQNVPLMIDPFQQALTAFNAELVKKGGEEKNCIRASLVTVGRWKKRLAAHNGSIEALVPLYHTRGGAGIRRMTDEVEAMVQAAIDNQGAKSSLSAYNELNAAIQAENLHMGASHKAPSYDTYCRCRDRVDDYKKHASKHGRQAAEYVFRSSKRLPPLPLNQFMKVWEIDHAVLDVVVVDRELDLVLWRPRVTIIIERVTRAIVGLTIGFETTSADTALTCLAMAIQPKVAGSLPQGVELIGDWNCYGLPQVIRVDNGSEFHSESFRAACQALGIEIEYCPRRKPWFKGAIERTIKTLNHQLVRSLPGASLPPYLREQAGANRDPCVTPEKMAVLDLFDLRRVVYNWAIDQYMHQSHKGLKDRAPAEVWSELSSPDRLLLPTDPDFLQLMTTKVVSRKPTHTGIQVCSLPYFNSPELQDVCRRYGLHKDFEVQVRYVPKKLDRIWFENPDTHEWQEILNHDPQTSQMSEAAIQLVNRKLVLAAKTDLPLTFVQAKKSMNDDLERIILLGKPREAVRAARILGLDMPSQVLKEPKKTAKRRVEAPPAPAVESVVPPRPTQPVRLSLIKKLAQSGSSNTPVFDRLKQVSPPIFLSKKS